MHFTVAHVLSVVSLLSKVSSRCTCRDVRSSAEVSNCVEKFNDFTHHRRFSLKQSKAMRRFCGAAACVWEPQSLQCRYAVMISAYEDEVLAPRRCPSTISSNIREATRRDEMEKALSLSGPLQLRILSWSAGCISIVMALGIIRMHRTSSMIRMSLMRNEATLLRYPSTRFFACPF